MTSFAGRSSAAGGRGTTDVATRQPAIWLIVSGLLLCLVIATAAVYFIDDLHARTIRESERGLQSLATVLAEQADRSLQAIELVQHAVLNEIKADNLSDEDKYVAEVSRREIHETLKTRIAALPQINAITFIDQNGKLLNFSRYWPIPNVNISDRDYFKSLSSDRNLVQFVSKPVQNRGDGIWTMYIARKITAPDGHFLGLILGAIELQYFEKVYKKVAPDADYIMSMFRDDGVLLARHPFLEQAIGQSFGGKLIVAEGAGVTGQTRGMSPVDGQEKFIFSAHLANFPIALRVGRSVEAVLAPWRRQAWALGSTAAALDGGLLALIVLGVRHLRGQRSLALALAAQAKAEACERGERDLREQYACFGNALDNMVQGLCLFDRDDRLIVMNARFADLHAVPDHLRRPGSTLGDLLDHFAASDCEGALRPASTSACTTPRLARTFTFDLPDGRTLTVVHAPIPAGGWLCTHEDVSEQRNREAQIAFLARHDALTGLPNRVPLGEWLDEILAHQDGRSAAVLCLDLDGFKFVNDTLGHPAGDELLRRVARRLKNTVGVADLIARLGGDEFVVVRTAATSTIDFAPLCEQIIEAMHRPFDVHGQSVTIGTSIGVATIATTEPNRDALLRCADMALYQAKALGRGTWCAFDPAMDAEAQRRRYLVDDLRRALDQDQFELHYQPLVEAGTRALRGFEALLRWRHPERGLVSPAEFIPLAEETGLIRMIGAWVVRRACLDAASWPESLKIAINLSPVQFVQSNLVEQIKQAIVSSGIAATRVELEITEAILLQDSSMVLDTLHCLRNLGVRISMDDFGTGYSSLSYLRSFPFDKIKIDQSFVRSLERDPEGVEIIRAVVSLGKALGMAVLAEGVETAEQHEILRREGCDELQGYLFSRPKPHAEAIEIFENEASWRCAS